MAGTFPPPLDKERHLKYWQRCIRTVLPHQYTSNDSTRMALGFFIIAAVDLLSAHPAPSKGSQSEPTADLTPKPVINNPLLSPLDRRRFRQWVLACQHAGGGFCGSPTHALPGFEYDGFDFASGQPEMGSPAAANIAATSFALLLLALLADEAQAQSAFSGVDRGRTLRWLRRLQREDGSFGEVLEKVPNGGGKGESWVIAGGRDMRYCYLAAMVRWMLRGDIKQGEKAWVEDIDVDALVAHIRRGQTYDGGVAESSEHEAHAGYAYCAVSALSLLDRPAENCHAPHPSKTLRNGIPDIATLIGFLASRKFVYLEEQEEYNDNDSDNFAEPLSLSDLSLDNNIQYVGYNGRCNKVADTCYCWWVAGALSILDRNPAALLSHSPSRAFLLSKTQHLIGGFAKHAGGPPDVYHSFLGLAALATMGEPTLKPFDPALCVSTETVRKIGVARQELLRRAETGGQTRDVLELGTLMAGGWPKWLAAKG